MKYTHAYTLYLYQSRSFSLSPFLDHSLHNLLLVFILKRVHLLNQVIAVYCQKHSLSFSHTLYFFFFKLWSLYAVHTSFAYFYVYYFILICFIYLYYSFTLEFEWMREGWERRRETAKTQHESSIFQIWFANFVTHLLLLFSNLFHS